MSNDRGSGQTTQQMQAAPPGAVFVWCNTILHYPRDLARHLGRTDLRIVSPSWVSASQMAGGKTPIAVDHAAYLTFEQRDAIRIATRSAEQRAHARAAV